MGQFCFGLQPTSIIVFNLWKSQSQLLPNSTVTHGPMKPSSPTQTQKSKMSPTSRHFLPLLLLLSLSLLFLHSHFRSSLPDLTPNPIPNRDLRNPQNPRPASDPHFTLILKVLAYNRLAALSRCLRSLAAADYLSRRVHLHLYLDHAAGNETRDGSILDPSHAMLEFVDGFDWRFGEKLVHYRTGNVGLQAQWLEVWWPSSDDEFVFVLEDDLEVSPLFYRFIDSVIRNYYYNSSNFSPSIYGASLQRPRFVPGKHGNKIKLDDGTQLFLYQLVGTWGQLLFPKPWKEFRLWYDIHKAKGMKPILEGMVTTGWYKRIGEKIWTPWFIKFIHSRGYFNIYTNFLRERAFSVSHRDAGVNYGKTAGPDSILLDETNLDFNLLDMKPLSHLKWYDFCFRELRPRKVVSSSNELGLVLQSVQKQETVVFVSLFGVADTVSRNLLCQFQRLNVWNYVLLSSKPDLLADLARRGHPVIDANQFLDGFQDSGARRVNEILVKAYTIKKSLESGFSSWMVDGNSLWLGTGLLVESHDPAYEFHAGRNLDIFFARSSPSARKIWDDNLLHNAAKSALPKHDTSFASIMSSLLEQKGGRVKDLDEASLGMKIDSGEVNQSAIGNVNKMIYWSEMDPDLIQKRLEELGMWNLDDDSSCKAVVCHQS